MLKSSSQIVAVAILAWVWPSAGVAQSQSPLPVTVGPRIADGSANGRKLNLTLSVEEAYDQNLVVQAGGTTVPLFQGSGFYTMFTPSFEYASSGERVQLAFNAGSTLRHYASLDETVEASHSIGAGFSINLSPETSMSFNQAASYAPALLYGLFATTGLPTLGQVVPSAANYSLNGEGSYVSDSSANLTRRLSRRASIMFSSDLKFTTFTGQNPYYPDMKTREAGSRFSYFLTRGLSMRVGYKFRQADYVGSPRLTEHNVDVGLEYSRPLSRTRKTSMTLSVGPTLATTPLVVGSPLTQQQYRVVVDASLRRDIARTWGIQGTYRRGMGYIEGFKAPVFTAAYAGTIGGLLTRRMDLSATAAYSTGESALTGSPSEFITYRADARLGYALNRRVAVYGQYVLYYYKFNEDFPLPSSLPPGLTRNGLRLGLMMAVPMRQR